MAFLTFIFSVMDFCCQMRCISVNIYLSVSVKSASAGCCDSDQCQLNQHQQAVMTVISVS